MSLVSESAKKQFQERGFMVLPAAIPQHFVSLLREECAYFLGYMDARMDSGNIGPSALSVRGRRYFINDMYRYSDRLWRFLFSDLMAEVCRSTIGDNAVLFNEQWVVKGAEQGMAFAWHQDSGYVKAVDPATSHPPYLTCWCTLDDVSPANGTVHVLDHRQGGTRGNIITHSRDEQTNDLIGYSGDLAGTAVEAPAGSIVAFSSYNLHASGANTTEHMRRVYLAQYAEAPILDSRNGEQFNLAVPFLRDGKIIYDRKQDTAGRWGGKDAPVMAAG